jgi:23S rRNA (adenine2503-C2)-methyltransferase
VSPSPPARPDIGSYRPDLAAILSEQAAPAYRYRQVYEHLTQHPGVSFSAATSLPGELRDALDEAGHSTLALATRSEDPDGTTKLLLKATSDGAAFEAVIMRHRKRSTVCVSTQVGCALGCAFCATGSLGFTRDLTAAEIVDQVREAATILAEEGRRVTNIVYMGMGEPLLNLDAVLLSLKLLHDPEGMGHSARSLSVSTVGIPAGIRRMAREEPQVNLALSLHAANEELRSRLIPANRRFPLRDVLSACEDHFSTTRRKLFVEYLLLAGVNDSPRQANVLADLLRGRVVAVNLIPWNPGCGDYRPSPREALVAFMNALKTRGIEVSVRESRGRSIVAACGQLVARGARRPVRDTDADQGADSETRDARESDSSTKTAPSTKTSSGRKRPPGPDPRRRPTRDGR